MLSLEHKHERFFPILSAWRWRHCWLLFLTWNLFSELSLPPLLSFLLIVLHVEYSATIPFTSWPAFLLCPKEKPHSVSFLPIFLSLDSEVNQMPSGISMPLPTLLSKNSIKYQINIESRDPLLTKSKTVKTNTQYYTIRWRKILSKYINFWQTFIP